MIISVVAFQVELTYRSIERTLDFVIRGIVVSCCGGHKFSWRDRTSISPRYPGDEGSKDSMQPSGGPKRNKSFSELICQKPLDSKAPASHEKSIVLSSSAESAV